MGLPCCFIRLAGCPYRCVYCDTAYAYDEPGEEIPIAAILDRLKPYPCRLVEITGGEPLAQRETPELARALQEAGYSVLVETSGRLPINALPEGVGIIMDIKTPGSGCSGFHPQNLARLRGDDSVKFVICGREDFEWAVRQVRDLALVGMVEIYFSPAWERVAPSDLAGWILEAGLAVRLQIPLHKRVWGAQRAR